MAAGSTPVLALDLVQARGKLFKILDRALSLLVMTGTGEELYDIPWCAIPGSMSAWRRRWVLEDPLARVDDPLQRTTPCARPGSTLLGKCRRRARPGAPCSDATAVRAACDQSSLRPHQALNFITQSRTIWSVTPPTFAASSGSRLRRNRRQRRSRCSRPILRPCGDLTIRAVVGRVEFASKDLPPLATAGSGTAVKGSPPLGSRLPELRYESAHEAEAWLQRDEG